MTAGRIFAVIPAAGIGARMRAAMPKQYLPLAGRRLAEHTLERLLKVTAITSIQVALHADDHIWPTLSLLPQPRIHTNLGGDSRADSVLKALQALRERAAAGSGDWVLVHDMARPCVRGDDIERLLTITDTDGGLLAAPVIDTIKQATANGEQARVAQSLDRDIIWRALTPQFFPFGVLLNALKAASASQLTLTDEASAMEQAGYHPRLIRAHSDNIKVTQPQDLALAAFYLTQQQEGA